MMECESFRESMMDALYEELDPPALNAFVHHAESCSECRDQYQKLQQTRRILALGQAEPDAALETRILNNARSKKEIPEVRQSTEPAPFSRRVLSILEWGGKYAIRPQFAMAALFVFVIGSSLLLLRYRSGHLGTAVEVTEQGRPFPDTDVATLEDTSRAPRGGAAPEMASPPKLPSLSTDLEQAAAGADKKDGASLEEGPQESRRDLPVAEGEAANSKKKPAKSAESAETKEAEKQAETALKAARAERDQFGCEKAISKYNAVNQIYPNTTAGKSAAIEVATCNNSLRNATSNAADNAAGNAAAAKGAQAAPAAQASSAAKASSKASGGAGSSNHARSNSAPQDLESPSCTTDTCSKEAY